MKNKLKKLRKKLEIDQPYYITDKDLRDAKNYVDESCTLSEIWLFFYDINAKTNHAKLYRLMYFDLLILSCDERG